MTLRLVEPGSEVRTGPFGGFSPYWYGSGGRVWVGDSMEEIAPAVPDGRRALDPAGVLELLQLNYLLGSRTLIRGVRRLPWRAALDSAGVVRRDPPIPHGHRVLAAADTARRLRQLLEEELAAVVGDEGPIRLLLSGGLDSRVVAGVLHDAGPGMSGRVVATTWGLPDSRDVVYARRIAGWFGWPHEHLRYDSALTWQNIELGAIRYGAEVAGFHLHGATRTGQLRPCGVTVAASFGDSIGRAEFSSRHLVGASLVDLDNPWDLIHPALYRDLRREAEADRREAVEGADRDDAVARRELALQEGYMRRMICHALDPIRRSSELYQAFTARELVAFMWSLDPSCRTDDVYRALLTDLDPRLSSLPWARTGVAPDGTRESDPDLRPAYHEVGRWLRGDLADRLEALVFAPDLRELGIFDAGAVRRLWRAFRAERDPAYHVAEKVVLLASVELLRRALGAAGARRATPVRDAVAGTFRRVARRLGRKE